MLNERDQERFLRYWTSAQPSVSNYIHALVRDHGAAKDVIQETAMVLYRRFPEYDESRPFLAWALGVARHQVMGLRRDATRELLTFDEQLMERFTESWAEIAPQATDREVALHSCLGRLAAHARRLVRLRYFEDLSAGEIAQQAGGNEASVRMALRRIREQLRTCVERELNQSGARA
jgi:RNA polymerase sigma-70 factor (ECF subfamily)